MAFDVISPALLGRGAIGISPSTFHTVDTDTRTILKNIDVCNTTAVDKQIRIYLVPNGDSAGTANALIYDLTIPGNGAFQWEGGAQVLNAGDFIQLESDAVGCTANISGAIAV